MGKGYLNFRCHEEGEEGKGKGEEEEKEEDKEGAEAEEAKEVKEVKEVKDEGEEGEEEGKGLKEGLDALLSTLVGAFTSSLACLQAASYFIRGTPVPNVYVRGGRRGR
jgi:hypothetical protein